MIKESFVVAFLLANGTFEGSVSCEGKSDKDYSCKHVVVMRKEIKKGRLTYVDAGSCGKDFTMVPLFESYLWPRHRTLPFPKATCEDDEKGRTEITFAKGSWQ